MTHPSRPVGGQSCDGHEPPARAPYGLHRDVSTQIEFEREFARRAAKEAGAPLDEDFDPNVGADDGNPIGMPESELIIGP